MKHKMILLILSIVATAYLQSQTAIILPDSASFFPLQKGSYWVYEQFLEGEIQKGNRQTDSTLDVVKKESLYVARIERKREQCKNKTFEYIIDENGIVYLKKKPDSQMEKFCKIIPHPGDSVAGLKYSSFLDKNGNAIRLETAEYDKANSEEKLEWQGRTFEKGIGLVSFGSASAGMDLVRYRIGMRGGKIYKKR